MALWVSRSIMSFTGESIFSLVKILFLKSKKSTLCIGWKLANTGDATLELNLSQLQRHLDTCDAMLVPGSNFEPTLRVTSSKNIFLVKCYSWSCPTGLEVLCSQCYAHNETNSIPVSPWCLWYNSVNCQQQWHNCEAGLNVTVYRKTDHFPLKMKLKLLLLIHECIGYLYLCWMHNGS